MIKRRKVQQRSRRPDQAGIAMVELTIVLPVILLLILGVTEIGRALIRYNALTKSVQDGARHAAAFAIRGSTGVVDIDAQLTSEVQNVVVYGNPDGTGSPILDGLVAGQVALTDIGGGEIRVDATYPYVPLFGTGIPTFGLGSGPLSLAFNMQAAVNMRAL